MGAKNALICLGGGPSPVINASLQGVLERCLAATDKMREVYCASHGIEGVLLEELIDMRQEDPRELARLRSTPASGAIGTCRYKLGAGREEDFDRILEVFKAHDIGYFFYIGGNDSMDTADKVSELARQAGLELVAVGVPKTIDNDLGDEACTIIDHTPGYGSAARYWANLIREVDEENRGICVSECVSVFQAMGRAAGFLTAASRLADPGREMPLQLYLAECSHSLEFLAENVNRQLHESGRCIVVVNEGFDVGDIGARVDGFGHIEYGASQKSACQGVVNYLNSVKLRARGYANCQVPGVLQRCTGVQRSPVDVQEAYEVGLHGADLALAGESGYMATILREPGAAYRVRYDKVPLRVVANSERFLPESWIAENRIDVTDDFVRYAAPLIGEGIAPLEFENGILRFARLERHMTAQRCPKYVPVGMRG
ncbi:MAG: diphosphate--fructose-6-phosphate 1-phosphotransferase [Oscillospiraceae bacterium]|nr:diphosphate--fructose-6-phosphate 1-phosphotransferase [Oscillospiraceae bacterium]